MDCFNRVGKHDQRWNHSSHDWVCREASLPSQVSLHSQTLWSYHQDHSCGRRRRLCCIGTCHIPRLTQQRFWCASPESVEPLHDKFRIALCDGDPSVMGAAVCLFEDLVRSDPVRHKDLVPTFVSILKQVVDHSLPVMYDYHAVSSPWMQVKLLKILAILGHDDKKYNKPWWTLTL